MLFEERFFSGDDAFECLLSEQTSMEPRGELRVKPIFDAGQVVPFAQRAHPLMGARAPDGSTG